MDYTLSYSHGTYCTHVVYITHINFARPRGRREVQRIDSPRRGISALPRLRFARFAELAKSARDEPSLVQSLWRTPCTTFSHYVPAFQNVCQKSEEPSAWIFRRLVEFSNVHAHVRSHVDVQVLAIKSLQQRHDHIHSACFITCTSSDTTSTTAKAFHVHAGLVIVCNSSQTRSCLLRSTRSVCGEAFLPRSPRDLFTHRRKRSDKRRSLR